MNKLIQKKELLLLLSLCTLVVTPIIKAEEEVQVTTPQLSISEQENKFIEEIVQKISHYVIHLEKEVKRFLDVKDKNPYKKHVDGFHDMLKSMHADIVAPVAQEMQSSTHSSPFYTALIQETNIIVIGLYDTLDALYTMLNKNCGTKDLSKMAAEFKQLQGTLKAQLNSLLPRIQKLQHALTQPNPALSVKIGEFATNLTQLLSKKGGNPMELLSQINHRMKCR